MTSEEFFWLFLLATSVFLIGAQLIASSIGENAKAISDVANAIRQLNSKD